VGPVSCPLAGTGTSCNCTGACRPLPEFALDDTQPIPLITDDMLYPPPLESRDDES
jgi:hypothetical protein